MVGSLGHSTAVGNGCNLCAPGIITGNSFQHLAQHALSKEYFPRRASLLCPLILPLSHRELQWQGKLDLVWPRPRALAHLSRQVSRKIAFRKLYCPRSVQLPGTGKSASHCIHGSEVQHMGMSWGADRREERVRVKLQGQQWGALLTQLDSKPELTPQLRRTQPCTVTHQSPSDTARAMLQDGTCSSLKDSGTQSCNCSETTSSSRDVNG